MYTNLAQITSIGIIDLERLPKTLVKHPTISRRFKINFFLLRRFVSIASYLLGDYKVSNSTLRTSASA